MRPFWMFVGAILALAPAVNAQQSTFQKRFNEAWTAAQTAEAAGDWENAAQSYADVTKLAPYEPSSRFSLARCLAHSGRPDEALRHLGDAVEYGWNQAEQLRREPAFGAIRRREPFTRLLARIDELERETVAVYVPSGLDRSRPAPLIIAFHGRGENPHSFLAAWKQAADALGAVVAAPRGTRRISDGLANVWETESGEQARDTSQIDLQACEKLADEAIRLSRDRFPLDERRIVLSGYSQGAWVALRLLREHPERYAGAFAQATIYKSPGADFWQQTAQSKKRRVFLMVGELDGLRPRTEQAWTDLKAAEWDVRLEAVAGVGHEPPDDCARRQVTAIRFVLGE